MKKGFVTFVNAHPNYCALNDILIESVLSFTDLPIEVNSINFDFKHSSQRVHCKRIDVQTEDYANICYAKTTASLNTSFDIALQLDSDMIITKEAVGLLSLIQPDERFVLGSLHPHDPCNQTNIMSYYGINEKTQPYIHATYLFTKNSKDFLSEVKEMQNHLMKKGITPINFDETILNCALWKHNRKTCFTDCFDPYFEVFSEFTTDKLLSDGYGTLSKVKRLICHGCKDPVVAKNIYQKISDEHFCESEN
jgi:hypothetical protein